MISFSPSIAKVVYFNQSESVVCMRKNLKEFNVSANELETFKIQWTLNSNSLPTTMSVNSDGKSAIGIKVPKFEKYSLWTSFQNEFIPKEAKANFKDGFLFFEETLIHEESVFVIDLQLDNDIYHIELTYQYLKPTLLYRSKNKKLPEDALSITPIFVEVEDLFSNSITDPSWDDDQYPSYSKDLFYREEFTFSLLSPGLFPTL